MPLYEYRCERCGERIEVLQHFGEAPLTECARCGGHLEKLISAPALQFKGSGFYVNDYGRPKSGGGERKIGESTGEGKTEAKHPGKGEGVASKAAAAGASGPTSATKA
jgi:putative FmdB family regulatory protein